MFERDKTYRRNQLHKVWGGDKQLQQQGGILTPKGQPFIILISGDRGHRYGYNDEWRDGVFHYFGAGQVGPMVWLRGNRAIRDSGKDLHLFEEAGKGLRYRGQLDYGGFRYEDGVPDKEGEPRRAIVFLLTPHDGEPGSAVKSQRRERSGSSARWSMGLGQLRRRASKDKVAAKSTREVRRVIYERSEDLRVYVLMRANGTCEGCGEEGPFLTKARPQRPYLEPHHTERLSDGGPDHPAHVIALCPACHRRVHHGKDGDDYNRKLKRLLRKIEPA